MVTSKVGLIETDECFLVSLTFEIPILCCPRGKLVVSSASGICSENEMHAVKKNQMLNKNQMFINDRKIHAVVAFCFTCKSKNMRYSDKFQPLDFMQRLHVPS